MSTPPPPPPSILLELLGASGGGSSSSTAQPPSRSSRASRPQPPPHPRASYQVVGGRGASAVPWNAGGGCGFWKWFGIGGGAGGGGGFPFARRRTATRTGCSDRSCGWLSAALWVASGAVACSLAAAVVVLTIDKAAYWPSSTAFHDNRRTLTSSSSSSRRRGGASTSSSCPSSRRGRSKNDRPHDEEEDEDEEDQEDQDGEGEEEEDTDDPQKTSCYPPSDDDPDPKPVSSLNIAFCGNSILYYNDAPRMLQQLIRASFSQQRQQRRRRRRRQPQTQPQQSCLSSSWVWTPHPKEPEVTTTTAPAEEEGEGDDDEDMEEEGAAVRVYQNSCLRGGATLESLWRKGNGMRQTFTSRLREGETPDVGAPTVEALLSTEDGTPWDYVVMNDHTQSPVREGTKAATKRALRDHYVPLFERIDAVPILIQTAAYRVEGIKSTNDLGTFTQYTDRLQAGYEEYRQWIRSLVRDPSSNVSKCRVAPFGEAVRYCYRNHRDAWDRLYHADGFHPSTHGTLLLVYVLYATIFEQAPPPLYDAAWWNRSRYFPLTSTSTSTSETQTTVPPVPSAQEAMELRRVACVVCNVASE